MKMNGYNYNACGVTLAVNKNYWKNEKINKLKIIRMFWMLFVLDAIIIYNYILLVREKHYIVEILKIRMRHETENREKVIIYSFVYSIINKL